MDRVPDTRRDSAAARRSRMRDRARGQRSRAGVAPGAHRYETPEWLERSFVLPLTEPEVTDVPSQPAPRHDDAPGGDLDRASSRAVAPPGFVRPPGEDVDLVRVVKRADARRTATRTAVGGTGLAGLALIAYLLSGSPVVLVVAVVCAVAAAGALGVRLRLARAPLPHRDA